MTEPGVRAPLTALTATFLLALALRLAFVLTADADPDLHRGLFLDAAHYAESATALRQGRGPGEGPYLLSPLYPYVLALFPAVEAPPATNALLPVRLVQAVLGAVTAVLVALLAHRIAGGRAAWIAGILAATHGPAIHYEALVVVAGPQAFLLALVAVLAASGQGPGSGRWLAAGIALGLAAALRPTALAFGVGGALGLAVAARSLRAALRPAAFLLAGTALAVLPFTARNLVAARQPVLLSANGGLNLWVGNHAGAPGIFAAPEGYDFHGDPVGRALAEGAAGRPLTHAQASRWWADRARADALADPGAALARLGRKLLLFGHPAEIPQLAASFAEHRSRSALLRSPVDARWILILALLAPLALALAGGGGAARRSALPYLALAAYGAGVALFFMSGRYRAPVMPVAIALAAATVEALAASADRAELRRRALALVAAVLVLALGSVALYGDDGPLGIRERTGMLERRRGVAFLEEGRPGEAVQALRASLVEAESAAVRTELALALAAADRPREARAELERVLATGPDARAAFELGNLWMDPLGADVAQAEALRIAERHYHAALEVQPRFAEAHYNLGRVLVFQRRFAEALETLEAALALGTEDDPWRADAQRALSTLRGQ